MPNVKIVTDSSAYLEPGVAEKLGITVVPLVVQLGKKNFREGVDVTTDDFLKRVSRSNLMPTLHAPSFDTFQETYRILHRQSDQILSLHISSKLSDTAHVARQATEGLLGRSRITVVDSLTTSLGLGILVKAAAEAAVTGTSMDEIIRLIRGMIPHMYAIFFVETMDYLERAKRIGKAQAILGTMLAIKPLLMMEDGQIVPQEKVRTRAKAVEKLFEWTSEFAHIEQLAILQNNFAEDTADLLNQLEQAYPKREFPVINYGPSLVSHLGPAALGIMVYEGTHW